MTLFVQIYTIKICFVEREEKMTPTGIVLIVGFAVILVICIFIDKNASKRFSNEIKEKYPVKDSFGIAYVTEKGELLYYCPSGTLSGYKKWNLQDIGYISTYRGSFSLLDRDKKTMRGEYLSPSKKKLLKEKAYATFSVGPDMVNEYVEFIKKHGPHIQHISGGKVME